MKEYIRLPNGVWVKVIDNDQVPFCEVCGSVDNIEYHHCAPRHLFGDDADKWPISRLCRKCHIKWHQIVTPKMGEVLNG
ncbi:hypothetical protein KKH13_04800 [Patescibacteria group bacterium]|uniref:HNH endonuclease n=1 Tax=viral metagenome TaxID=1070528 RepID=A0A6M3KXN9_9ZZZZ|nr:hypothetical protein [Patescibacteria group bacterium]